MATSSGVAEIGSLLYSLSVSETLPKPPLRTLRIFRFIDSHINSVRIIPDAPTKDPPIIKITFETINPADIAATPDKELSKATTTGISAPPIRTTRRAPKRRATIAKFVKDALLKI